MNCSKGAASKKSKFREAMVEAFTNPLKFFQFNSDENDKIEKWLDGQDDVESNDTAWTLLGNKSVFFSIFLNNENRTGRIGKGKITS